MGFMVVPRRLMFSVYSLAGEYFVIRIFFWLSQNKNLDGNKEVEITVHTVSI